MVSSQSKMSTFGGESPTIDDDDGDCSSYTMVSDFFPLFLCCCMNNL
jgi:hypothetical protein